VNERASLRTRPAAAVVLIAALAAVLGGAGFGRAETGASEASPEAAAGRIVVSRQASVDDGSIRLGDLSELSGGAIEYAELELGSAPTPGATRRLSGSEILTRLRDAGLDEAAIRYQIPASVRVRRSAQELDSRTLEAAVREAVGVELQEGERLAAIETPRGVHLPVGAYSLSVGALERRGSGRGRVDVEVRQGDEVVAEVPVPLRLASSGLVVVARRPIEAGTLLGPADIAVERRPSSAIPRGGFADASEAVGKRARVALEAGRVLDHRSLESPPLVRRGDPVRIVIQRPGMVLSTVGRALENAAAGSVVRVVNPSSGRELAAEVIAHGQVRVLQ
jgi:flagellar basal body P-ring formation protein FlgA